VNAGGASRGGRYRPSRKRRISIAMVGLVAAVLAAALLVGFGAHTMMTHSPSCPSRVVAHVAVSSEYVPVASRVGGYFNSQHKLLNGRCEQVAISAAAPATVASELGGAAAGRPRPEVDAWIPDSQLWVDVARGTTAGAQRVPAAGPVLARTALLIAMPRTAAAKLPAFGSSVGWNFLLPQNAGGPSAALGLNVQFPDPTQTSTGLSTLVEFRNLLGYGRPARFALARFAFTVQVVPGTQGGNSLVSLDKPPSQGGSANPVTITTEQAALRYDTTHPQQPLAVRYPAQGSIELTFPYLVTAASHPAATVAKAFGSVLRSGYGTALARFEGFRSAAGKAGHWPIGYGLKRHEPTLLPQPGPNKAAAALRAWHGMSLGERLLALNDVSSSMAVKPVPGGPSLEQILGHAAALGIARFPDSTQMGLWAFASHLPGGGSGGSYKQLVPLGPLPSSFGLVTRRQAIVHLAGTATTVPNAGAALYRAILAAYKQMEASYQPQHANAVIVLTAGVDSPRDDISPATLLKQLKALYDRSKPVNVVVIMLGRAGDFAVMQQIAAATNGKAYDITSPGQIKRVFFHAMGRRICQPHCPPGR
jgi:extracellular solute-binding protein